MWQKKKNHEIRNNTDRETSWVTSHRSCTTTHCKDIHRLPTSMYSMLCTGWGINSVERKGQLAVSQGEKALVLSPVTWWWRNKGRGRGWNRRNCTKWVKSGVVQQHSSLLSFLIHSFAMLNSQLESSCLLTCDSCCATNRRFGKSCQHPSLFFFCSIPACCFRISKYLPVLTR